MKVNAKSKFFIAKTKAGDFHYGVDVPAYDKFDFDEHNNLWVNNRVIPFHNIDFYIVRIPLDDFKKYAVEYGFVNTCRFKKVMIDYMAGQGVNPLYLNYIRYMHNLKIGS